MCVCTIIISRHFVPRDEKNEINIVLEQEETQLIPSG